MQLSFKGSFMPVQNQLNADVQGAVVINNTVISGAEQQYRAGGYGLLASLFRSVPDQAILTQIVDLKDAGNEPLDELALAMSMLALAAKNISAESVDDEYHALFIGLGRGEMVPYGSWYLTGFLMEKPLSLLRDDLKVLGFQRDEGVKEPEDHVAALCEVMAMLVTEQHSLAVQINFFETHIAPWFERFFADLSQAQSAVFYRAVGRFGKAFTDFEKQYLSMKV